MEQLVIFHKPKTKCAPVVSLTWKIKNFFGETLHLKLSCSKLRRYTEDTVIEDCGPCTNGKYNAIMLIICGNVEYCVFCYLFDRYQTSQLSCLLRITVVWHSRQSWPSTFVKSWVTCWWPPCWMVRSLNSFLPHRLSAWVSCLLLFLY